MIQQGRISDMIAASRRALQDVEDHLFIRDGAPIWSPAARTVDGESFAAQVAGSLEALDSELTGA